ncbi:MAG: hypothetical protein M0C28_05385 [Candidatus Moduliflexus flocculans]|nr:hypothetical protein [Candidatus Moduliflexus flocculans]
MRTTVEVPPAALATLEGRYEMSPGARASLSSSKGRTLFADRRPGAARALSRIGDPLLRAGRGDHRRLLQGDGRQADARR